MIAMDGRCGCIKVYVRRRRSVRPSRRDVFCRQRWIRPIVCLHLDSVWSNYYGFVLFVFLLIVFDLCSVKSDASTASIPPPSSPTIVKVEGGEEHQQQQQHGGTIGKSEVIAENVSKPICTLKSVHLTEDYRLL